MSSQALTNKQNEAGSTAAKPLPSGISNISPKLTTLSAVISDSGQEVSSDSEGDSDQDEVLSNRPATQWSAQEAKLVKLFRHVISCVNIPPATATTAAATAAPVSLKQVPKPARGSRLELKEVHEV